jgi:phosphopantetheinyl transferase (holo-ACP synthase)
MVTCKLIESLRNPNDPEWELLSQLTLGENVHSDRLMSWCLSREALRICFEENGIYLNIKDLRVSGYSALRNVPQFTLSISHTKGLGAALIADKRLYRSVGIDIEREEREVKESIILRISHPKDFKLRKIELWCIKEAVFKAIMNTGVLETAVEFSSIWIQDKTWVHPPSKLEGEWELEVVKQVVIARALVKNETPSQQDAYPQPQSP